MFEVFDAVTGQTVGFVETEWLAFQSGLEYICADHASTLCPCFRANRKDR